MVSPAFQAYSTCISKMTEQNIRECFEKASETISRSVSYLSSKGMIDEEKGTSPHISLTSN